MIRFVVLIIIEVALFSMLGWLLATRKTAYWYYRKYKRSVTIKRDIPYIDDQHPRHKLDLYLPRNGSPRGMVLFVHGGYWKYGNRRYHTWITGLYDNIGICLARAGWGCAVTSYRLAPEVTIEAQLDDIAAAFHATLRHATEAKLPARVVTMGHSAGGQLVSLLAMSAELQDHYQILPSTIGGCIALSPVLDIPTMLAQNDERTNANIGWLVFGTDSAVQRRYSPSTYMQPLAHSDQPIIVLVGSRDIPYVKQTATTLCETAITSGANLSFYSLPTYTHAQMVTQFSKQASPVQSTVFSFLEQCLQST